MRLLEHASGEARRTAALVEGLMGIVFPRARADRKHRRATGSFETPSYIARFLVKKAMERRLADLLHTFDSQAQRGAYGMCEATLHEMMSLRLLDPSVGRGIFLLEGLDVLRSFFRTLSRCLRRDTELSRRFHGELELLRRPGMYALRHSLYAVDLSAEALEIALFTLLEAVQDELEPSDLPMRFPNFKAGNSLVTAMKCEDRGALDAWKIGSLIATRKKIAHARPWQVGWLFDSAAHGSRELSREQNVKLLKYFNSTGALLDESACAAIASDPDRLREELQFTGSRAREVSSFQPPSAFNWEIEFPEAFYDDAGTPRESPGFDFVVGNPPWGASIDELRQYIEDYHPDCCRGYKDSFKLFLGRSLALARPGGFLAQVLPNSFQFMPSYRDVRDLLMTKKIHFLANLGEGVFPSVSTPCSLLVLENSPWRRNYLQVLDLSRPRSPEKRRRLEQGAGARWLDQAAYHLTDNGSFLFFVRTAAEDEVPLGEAAVVKDPGIQYHRTGCGMSNRGKSDLAERLFYEGPRRHPFDVQILKGCDLEAFAIDYTRDRFLRHNFRALLDRSAGETIIFNEPFFAEPEKVLWRQTAERPVVAVEGSRRWFLNTLQGAYVKQDYADVLSHTYLAALLNSSLMGYFYGRMTEEKGRAFPQVRIGKMKALPLRLAGRAERGDIERRSRELTILRKTARCAVGFDPVAWEIVRSCEEALDALIFDLYRVSARDRNEMRAYLR